MPAVFDIDSFTIRFGPEMHAHGDPYVGQTTGVIQHDRIVYLSKLQIEGKTDIRDLIDCVRRVREHAPEFGWGDILWARRRVDHKTGKKFIHFATIPIKPTVQESYQRLIIPHR